MTKTLYIMCGPAGAGKSTWAKENADPGTAIIISRDKIRYSMVNEDEKYFSKENAVYKEFIRQIQEALDSPIFLNIYADATHLTEKSRKLLLNRIAPKKDTKINAVVILPSLGQVLTQNAQRQGRERIPDTVVENMYDSFQHPKYDNIEYNKIIEVGD